ncbi:HAD family hydrolase [Glycomyces terrestris]|uniref:HAD family phosphatase n=1 Tax=Glycomyces terrestris TaxID=2493553 RepID=A0A426UTC8_9ACTN|nr:HAD family phosphatase [Glycomyces terrestris]RRR96961.1 HAD family phosphatase [Glycomyces terrestris]
MAELHAFPQAVLFDMDGTLLDSEPRWDTALEELAVLLGGTLRPEVRDRMVGSNEDASVVFLLEDLGLPVETFPEHVAWLRNRMKTLFADGVDWKPGARELLLEVRAAGIPTALVTSTARELTEVLLQTLDPANFDVIICGDEVQARKPDPEPYRTAAEKLGVDITRTIAIEDSRSGSESALAAGAVTIAVPSEVALPDDLPAHRLDTLAGVTLARLRAVAAA